MKAFSCILVFLLVEQSVWCIPLDEFYPFGIVEGDIGLPRNDDGSSRPIMLNDSVFPFFDRNFRIIFVNTNGAISFTNPISQYTPDPFPIRSNQEIIAPYWADVDIRGTGNITYRVTDDGDLLQRADNNIKRAFPTTTFSSEYIFIATWDHVGYYNSQTHKTNTFQAVLATDGLRSYVIYLYADDEIQWTTGDASSGVDGLGGTPAQVGFDAGDGIRFAAITGSGTNAIINVTDTSNVGVPGMWIFRTDEDAVVIAGCERIAALENASLPITLFPRYGNTLGGTLVQVFGPCFDEFFDYDIICTFDDIAVQGMLVDKDYIICVSPSFIELGIVTFTLTISDTNVTFEEKIFYSLDISDTSFIHSTNERRNLFYVESEIAEITWDPDSILPQSLVEMYGIIVTLNIQLVEVDTETGDTRVITTLASNVFNTGRYSVEIPPMSSGLSQAVLQITIGEIISSISTVPEHVQEIFDLIQEEVAFWSHEIYVSGSSYLRDKCDEWCSNEPEGIGEEILARLPPCPPTVGRAMADSVFEEENLPLIGELFRETFHPGSSSCFRQVVFTDDNEGSGQQCCYDNAGQLIVGPPGGGTVDRYAPNGFSGFFKHQRHDVIPYFYCCVGDFSDCESYYKKRPSDDGSRYVLQPPACVYGDPHLVTLDGFKYTFNGKGEFTLIAHEDELFTLQGRMVEAESSIGSPVSATVFSAIAAKEYNSDTVQFRRSRRGLDALVNGVMVNFEDLQKQEFNNVTVSNLGNSTMSALFSSGAYVQAKAENEIISVLLVSLPDSYYNQTYGLMGIFNNDMTDDLMINNLTWYLPLNSSNEIIHQEFGLSWIITEAESLFTYSVGESWATFYDPSFVPAYTPVFLDSALESAAIEACNNDTFCLYDIATTGRMDIGLSTLDGSRSFDEIVQLSYPVVCDPPCVQGACVANDTCNCAEGYTGDSCTEPVYTPCDINRCRNGGRCSRLGVSYICNCVNGYFGTVCEKSNGTRSDDDDFIDTTGFIVVVAVGGAVIIIAVLVMMVVCCCCICCKPGSTKANNAPHAEAAWVSKENRAYAINAAYANQEDYYVNVAVAQDAKLTENAY